MMLQPIVAEHQARTGSDEQLGTARAIDACDDGDAGGTGQHHRFVAHLERIVAREDTRRILTACAVTAQQHTDRDPARRQRRSECGHQGAFTGAADRDVADHHDGHGGSMHAHQTRPIGHTMQSADSAVEPRQRQQPRTTAPAAVPDPLQPSLEMPRHERLRLSPRTAGDAAARRDHRGR